MATIIKASGSNRPLPAVPYNLDDMAEKAQGCLDDVRSQAAAILKQAQRQADQIRRQAEEQVREAAIQAAEMLIDEKIERQMATLLPAMRQAIDAVEQQRQSWLSRWEKSAVQLATKIAARVIRREVSQQPEITLTLVKEALELATGNPEIRLRMHPEDVATMGDQVRQMARELARLGNAEVIADPQVSRGGCRLETAFGTIDQQFEAQLARIEEELT